MTSVLRPVLPYADDAPSADAWSRSLVDPERAAVDAALRSLPASPACPRAGLGGALCRSVARAWGVRRWQEAARVATAAIEAANQRVWLGLPDDASPWLHGDVGRLRRVWDGLVRRDEALVRRVVARASAGAGGAPLPEMVLFLRGSVAAGVLCGDVPDGVHAALDVVVTWLGLAWEAAAGALDADRWHGALRAVGLDAAYPDDPFERARAEARTALTSVDGVVAERLADAIEALPRDVAVPGRRFEAWIPRNVPWTGPARPPAPTRGPARASVGPARTLAPTKEALATGSWPPAASLAAPATGGIEGALADVVAGGPGPLARAVGFLQSQPGKRVRSRLALAAAVAVGGREDDALQAAAMVEWLHEASLVLDDIVDEAKVRRGQPTLHHATDVPFAVGVAGFVLARVHAATAGADPRVRRELAAAAAALADGQRAELGHTGDHQLSLTAYYRIIELKTARLFACAASVGAVAGGGSPAASTAGRAASVAALARYGREAGLAFQIVDDVLDYTGDARVLGKRPGTDLRARKPTLPWLVLRDRLDVAGRERLASLLDAGADGGRRTADGFAWVREQMLALGIAEDCLDRARVHRDRAVDALGSLPTSAGKDVLVDLADRFVARSR